MLFAIRVQYRFKLAFCDGWSMSYYTQIVSRFGYHRPKGGAGGLGEYPPILHLSKSIQFGEEYTVMSVEQDKEMLQLQVIGMDCMGCVKAVEKAMRRVDPDAVVVVDLPTGNVTIEGTQQEKQAFEAAVIKAGFGVSALA